MLEFVNALACAVVFAYCFIASWLAPARGLWISKVVLWVVTTALGLGIMAPWSDWLPASAWQDVLLNASLALALLIWRREAMAFVRCKFTIPARRASPRRRSTDWAELRELHERHRHQVAGGGDRR